MQRVNQDRPVERDHDGDGIVEEGTPNAHRVSRPTTSGGGGGGGGGGSIPPPKFDSAKEKIRIMQDESLGANRFNPIWVEEEVKRRKAKAQGKDDDLIAEFAALAGDEEVKRQFSREERDKAAEEHTALPDGSYPIKNRSDLADAIQAYGRAKDKAKCKAHIIKRARALNAMSSLPDGWA